MACTHDKPCGCKDDSLTTLPDPCDTEECVGEICDEVIKCDCVTYTGPDIPSLNIQTGDSVCDIIQRISEVGGVPGDDGVGISDSSYDENTGELTLTFTDNTTFTTGDLRGENGNDGERGVRGKAGLSAILGPLDDTGWVALNGFNHYGSVLTKPQARRIGRIIHLRGLAIIPLSSNNGSTVINISTSSPSSISKIYENDRYVQTYTGAGGCTIDTNGSITFNKDVSVIPSTVLSTAADGSFTVRNKIINRRVRSADEEISMNLTSVVDISITSTGKLIIGTAKDVEQNNPSNSLGLGSNLNRVLISKMNSGWYLNDLRSLQLDAKATSGQNNLTVTAENINSISPITIDAGDPEDLGGFLFQLDGMTLTLPPVIAATITSVTVGSITSSGASLTSNVTNSGGGTIYYRGFVFSKTTNPTVNDDYILSSTNSTGSYTLNLTELESGTTYYVKSFVVNEFGTIYSTQTNFTTL
jgi:hypothetical protein